MTKLKTLKDIGIKNKETERKPNLIRIYDSELRREVIKRAKCFSIRMIETDSPILEAYYQGKKEEIMEFYNITEKDLQSKEDLQ